MTSLALCTSALIASCANVDQKTQETGIGAALGCAAGAAIAKLTSNNAAGGCAAGAVVGGIAGYLHARNAEIDAARQAAAQSTQNIQGATVSPVQTDTVQVTDKTTGETKQVQAFKSVSVDIPVSQLNTQDGQDAMKKLNDYARKVASDRGETVDMTIATAPTKGTKTKTAMQQTSETVGKGTVRRTVLTDSRVPANVERVTIEVKNPSSMQV
jgi:hypothetical protein